MAVERTPGAVAQLPTHKVELLLGVAAAVGYETTIDEHSHHSDLLAGLLPVERPAIQNASPRRAGEFAAGRACARAAMSALGLPDQALPQGDDRSPQWPDGVAGSISHTGQRVLAVAARSDDLASDPASDDPASHRSSRSTIGVDTERRGRVHRDLYQRLFTPAERARFDAMDCDDEQLEASLVFSAKEAIYKAQYRITGAWVGFTDVAFDRSATGALIAQPASDLAVLSQLRWPIEAGHLVDEQHVTTGVVIHSAAPSSEGKR